MCGRFALTDVSAETLTSAFGVDEVPDLAPRYNIAPTQPVATVIQDAESGRRRLAIMRWGLIPSWSKDLTIGSRLINARGETVHEKPSFRVALRKRRCLVVADGFYEWQAQPSGPKQPLFIGLTDGAPFGMAGLYEYWTEPESGETLTTCAIITTAANEFMAPIHNRMPVILPRDAYDPWLDPTLTDPVAALSMLNPYPPDLMTAYPVSRRVNSPANDDPSVIERAG